MSKKENNRVYYLQSEKEYQIKEMEKLGINTRCQPFEQCVNSLIYMGLFIK